MRHQCAVVVTLIGIVLSTIFSVQAQAPTMYITTQRFDSGLMIWRSDNSTIYVLGNNGTVLVFPSTSYSNLPDNPIFGTPASRLRPIFGFGKVWGHAKKVRDLIGWPTLQEIGFNTTVLVQKQTIFIYELDGSLIQINNNGTWTHTSAPIKTPTPITCPYPLFFNNTNSDVCADQPITSQAAYQTYEGGFMIWLAHSGDVWVFVSSGNRWQHFAQSNYEGFADAAPETAPTNRVQPINAFGRVWYNLKTREGQSIRTALGWATAGERGYTATYQRLAHATSLNQYLSLPDGRVLGADINGGISWWTWNWVK